MNIKYIISLNALVALAGASCWGNPHNGQSPLADLLDEPHVVQLYPKSVHNHDLWIAVLQGDHDATVHALNNGANVDVYNGSDGFSALMVAAIKGYDNIVATLLKHKANFNETDSFNRTALDLATEQEKRSKGENNEKYKKIIEQLQKEVAGGRQTAPPR